MPKSPRLFLGIIVAVVLFGGFFVIAFRGRPVVYVASNGALQSGIRTQSDSVAEPQKQISVFRPAQVSVHNSAQGCWTVINGSVYDLTTWINRHPGGPEAILGLCGSNGTDAFNRQHGRSLGAEYALGLLKIGTLQ